jgi:hypothetical protein
MDARLIQASLVHQREPLGYDPEKVAENLLERAGHWLGRQAVETHAPVAQFAHLAKTQPGEAASQAAKKLWEFTGESAGKGLAATSKFLQHPIKTTVKGWKTMGPLGWGLTAVGAVPVGYTAYQAGKGGSVEEAAEGAGQVVGGIAGSEVPLVGNIVMSDLVGRGGAAAGRLADRALHRGKFAPHPPVPQNPMAQPLGR